MGDLFAIALPSGIGARFQDLSPSKGDAILFAASHELPPDGTVGQLLAIEAKMGYEAMVREVTAGPLKKKAITHRVKDPATGEELEVKVGEEPDLNHPENKWVRYDPDGPTPFSNKDHSTLKSLYMDRNKVAPGEVAAIMGKAVSVVL